eukprot:5658141-Amphidinium_carterae.1
MQGKKSKVSRESSRHLLDSWEQAVLAHYCSVHDYLAMHTQLLEPFERGAWAQALMFLRSVQLSCKWR